MKNVYLKYICSLLLGFNAYSQGSDVIFWVDNSGSINATEYGEMSVSIRAIMQNVLQCNSANRVTVVQYGGTETAGRIWIETPFTNTLVAFANRYGTLGPRDNAHGSLGLIGNALDNIPNANILSPLKVLTRTPGNSLVIYFFTDAVRDFTGSSLVNSASNGVGTDAAFQNYTTFKTARNATFIVAKVSTGTNNPVTDLAAKNAAAAIASAGGSYTESIESYPADPNGAGTVPRFFIYKTDFSLTSAEISNTSEQICSVAVDPCMLNLVLVSPNHNVLTSIQDNRQVSNSITASNVINNLAVGVYHAENTIVLKPGFHSMNGSRFRGYIEECPSGFIGREANNLEEEMSGNNQKLQISPNPSNDLVTITSSKSLIQHISILSLDGRVMLDKHVGGKEKYGLSISEYEKGLYLVIVTSDDGKTLKSKMIKN